MSEPLVSIIIATHNGRDLIQACLDSVFAQDYERIEVILVDNASTDGLGDFVPSRYPQVRQIRSPENLGYGQGNNLGASVANGELLLFLNHDTVVRPSFLTHLVEAMNRDPEIGAAQSKLLTAQNPDLIDSLGAYLTRTGFWYHPGRGESDQRADLQPFDILGACGTCLLVRRRVFDDLEGFDRDYVIYFDDADFTWRARLLGHRIVVVPRSVIYHWGGGTTQNFPSAFTVYHSFKNRLCSLIKLLGTRELLLILPIHLTLCLGGSLVYFLRLRPANGMAILRALVWNLSNLRETRRKRRVFLQSMGGKKPDALQQLVRPLPVSWFLRTASGYFAKW